MPDTYPNPYAYTSPIGAALGNLQRTLFSGPSEAERIKAAEEALKLRTARVNTQKVADIFGAYNTPGFDRNAVSSAAVLAGYDPSDLAALERYNAANDYGATDPRTVNAQVGAGAAYSSTAPAFFTDQANANARAANALAENARQFDQTPQQALVNGEPVFVPRAGAFKPGVAPILSDAETKGTLATKNWANLDTLTPAQSRYIGSAPGADARAPKNYVAPDGSKHITYDGVTDAQSGAPLPGGGYVATAQGSADDVGLTNSTKTTVEKSNIALDQLDATINYTRKLIEQDPTNVGAVGLAKGFVQDANQVAEAAARGFGYPSLSTALDTARAKAATSGVSPTILSGLFNPTLPKVHQAYAVLVYQVASAIAGQQGRGASDADIQNAEKMVGNPESVFQSQQNLLATLDGLSTVSGLLRQNLPGAKPAPQQQPSDDIPVVQSPADAAKLPSGTKFRTPDGRVKVVP